MSPFAKRLIRLEGMVRKMMRKTWKGLGALRNQCLIWLRVTAQTFANIFDVYNDLQLFPSHTI
jgi:hypothetical protein